MIAELYEEKTGHLSAAQAAFFKHWERLLSLEEQDTTRLRAQLWTMTAKAREKAGRCFADMVLVAESNNNSQSLTKIHRWRYTFTRATTGTAPQSLLSGHISRGDPIQISLEPDLLCLARGFVTELTSTSVTVGVQAPLEVEQLLKRTRSKVSHVDTVAFRIDKDELSSGMGRMRGNLAHMFVPDGDHKRRSLVVDMVAPQFHPALAPSQDEIPASLNDDQRAAMAKVLTAKDYALILGMPGTGKTTTVAEIIKALVARGKSVLLTSYTHSAVDTIVLKLLDAEFPVLRIGNQDKVGRMLSSLTHISDSRSTPTSATSRSTRWGPAPARTSSRPGSCPRLWSPRPVSL
jgi:DNA replication ATP-dependent helicase Dna2